MERKFDLPLMDVKKGDSALLQITVTGNGWEYTQEQCGEYCDMKYVLRMNNYSHDIDQWRNDCAKNPNNMQKGDWYQARNGGCPGTVEPGVLMDISQLLQEGTNTMELHVLVWDNKTQHYLPYTNVKGWLFGEQAGVMISASVHVYASEVRESVIRHVAGHDICSLSEKVLIDGGNQGLRPSHPENYDKDHQILRKPEIPQEATSLLQQHLPKLDEESLEYVDHVMQNPEAAEQGPAWAMKLMQAVKPKEGEVNRTAQENRAFAGCWNFEATAPFYHLLHPPRLLEEKMRDGNAIRVPVITKHHFKGDSKGNPSQLYFTRPLNLLEIPFHWHQVGLMLKLESPDGEVAEHWPRTGSVGLEFNRDSEIVNTHDVYDPNALKALQAGAPQVGILGALLATLFALVA